MTREAVIFGVSGTMFGLLVGWIIGSQHARPVPAPQVASQASPQSPQSSPAPPPLDLQRASALEAEAKARPSDAKVRADLANLYFDAERFDLAVPWYEASLKLNSRDINVSTDLAVSYYYTNNADLALKQIDQSLAIDPNHGKTLLNQGIIRAFGKRDLAGAQASWEKVVKVAPNTPEALRAQQGLDGLRASQGAGGATGS
jgi:tetratricopeptide (TPR) repeat protein